MSPDGVSSLQHLPRGGSARDLWQMPAKAGGRGFVASDENWKQTGCVINHRPVGVRQQRLFLIWWLRMTGALVAKADCGSSAVPNIDRKRKWHDSSKATSPNAEGHVYSPVPWLTNIDFWWQTMLMSKKSKLGFWFEQSSSAVSWGISLAFHGFPFFTLKTVLSLNSTYTIQLNT